MKGNNMVILQGWLHLDPKQVQTQQDVSFMRAYLDTDRPVLGGRHHVVLSGKSLAKAQLLMKQNGGRLKIQAAVIGHLVTLRQQSHVVVSDLVLVQGTEQAPSSA